MKTLKEHLEENGIFVSDKTRYEIGKTVAWVWNSERKGKKTYKDEGEYSVRTYPSEFLLQKNITKVIMRILRQV